MPQFDFYTFMQQNFIFLVSFFIIYFFVLLYILPSVSETLKMRNKLIKEYGSKAAKRNIELVTFFYKHLFKAK